MFAGHTMRVGQPYREQRRPLQDAPITDARQPQSVEQSFRSVPYESALELLTSRPGPVEEPCLDGCGHICGHIDLESRAARNRRDGRTSSTREISPIVALRVRSAS